jgi:GNAT superfamily N-acetyltransferase
VPSAHPAPEIRAARPGDALALSGLLAELGFPTAPDVVAARLADLAARDELVLVAERAGVALGLLTVHVTPVLHRPTPVGRLTMLVVTQRARGQGVGRALVAAAERLLAQRGCGLVEVTSHRRLKQAHGFYERLGYEATSVRFGKVLAAGADTPAPR